MKFTLKLFTGFLFLAGVISCNNQPDTINTDMATPVSVLDVKPGSIETFITSTGTVFASQEVELMSEISGKYFPEINPQNHRSFKMGDQIKVGQVIIKFEDQEYENSIAFEAKQLNYKISEQEYEKQESLYKKGGITIRELKNSEISFINAKYEFENAEIKLAKMLIVAPFTGLIVDMPYYTVGTKLNTGLSMVKLMAYKKMYMEINLPEKNLMLIKNGLNVNVTSYVFPDDTLTGKVTEISPAISTETRTFKCKIQVNNPELLLRPGMFVKADIVTQRKKNVIVISKDYLLTDSRGKALFIVEQGTAHQRHVKTGLENQDQVEIVNGLKLNDRLVIKGFETLRDRSKVKVIK